MPYQSLSEKQGLIRPTYVPLYKQTPEERRSILEPPKKEKKIEPSFIEKRVGELKFVGEFFKNMPETVDEMFGITKAVKEKGLPKATLDTISSFGESLITAPFRTIKSVIAIKSPEFAEKIIPEKVPHPTELLLRAIGKEEWVKTSKPVEIGPSAQKQLEDCLSSGGDPTICNLTISSGVIFDAAILGGIATGMLKGIAGKPIIEGIKTDTARQRLNIEKGASLDEIKKSYYKEAHKTHPDKPGGSSTAFNEINEAYRTLTGVKPKTTRIKDIAYQMVKERHIFKRAAEIPEPIITPAPPEKKIPTLPAPLEEVAIKPVPPPAVMPTIALERIAKLTPGQKAIYNNKLAKILREEPDVDLMKARERAIQRAEAEKPKIKEVEPVEKFVSLTEKETKPIIKMSESEIKTEMKKIAPDIEKVGFTKALEGLSEFQKTKLETLRSELAKRIPEIKGVIKKEIVEPKVKPVEKGIFTSQEIREASEYGLDFTKVKKGYEIEARQSLEFLKEQKEKLSRKDYAELVKKEIAETKARRKEGITFREHKEVFPPKEKGVIPQELQTLAQEARKFKSAEEFEAEYEIVKDKIGKMPIGDRETFVYHWRERPDKIWTRRARLGEAMIKAGFEKPTDFYAQAVKGVEVKPTISEELVKPKVPKPVVFTPREAAKDMIKPYVERGDSLEDLRHQMGVSSDEYIASVGGYVNGKNVGIDTIVVNRVGKTELTPPQVFSLKEIFNEVKTIVEELLPPKLREIKPVEAPLTPEWIITPKGEKLLGLKKTIRATKIKSARPKEKKQIVEKRIFDALKSFSTKKSLPILNNIAVSGNKIMATDLESGLIYYLDKDSGIKKALPLDVLKGKSLDELPEIAERVKGMDIKEYPIIPEKVKKLDYKAEISLEPEILEKAISSASPSDSRPEINGVLFKATPKGLKIVSTDSFRLWQINLPIQVPSNLNFILPYESAKKLNGVLKKVRPDKIEIEIGDENQAIFTFDKFKFTSRLVSGEFPTYENIMINKVKTSFEVNRLELLNILKEAKPYVSSKMDVQLIPNIKKGTLKILAENEELGKFEKEIPALIEKNAKIDPKENQQLIMPIKNGEPSINIYYAEDFLKNAGSARIIGSENDFNPTVWREIGPEFRIIRQTPGGRTISREDAIKIVRKYFTAEEIGIEIVDRIRTADGHFAYGQYSDRIIKFIENPLIGTPEHEVVHAYIDLFVTSERKIDVLNEVKTRDNLRTLAEARERLAEDFISYVKGDKNFTKRLLNFFRDILEAIKRFFTKSNRDKIREFYEDIVEKKREKGALSERGIAEYKEISLLPEEKEAMSFIEKGEKVPGRLSEAIKMLEGRGIIKPPKKAEKRLIKFLGKGMIRPTQVEAIQSTLEKREISKQVFSQLRNGFTGRKRTKIEELTEAQGDELLDTILKLTPDKMGRIKSIVDKETINTMRDFIPEELLRRRAVTTADIMAHIKEKDINYIISLFRPIRKVLTSGEIEPNKQSIAERIYDTISEAEEDFRIQFKNWYNEKLVKLYKEARKKDKNTDINIFGYIEQGWKVPAETKKLAEFLSDFYVESLPVMKPKRIRKGYITHTKPTFLERLKEAGIRQALKEVIEPNVLREENIEPTIIQALEYIVSKEKFNPFALPRSQYAAYSRKLMKSARAYASLYFYKKNFDPVIPKVLTMKKFLPGHTQTYITKYLQTIGGRPFDFRLWMGPWGRTIKKIINTGIRFEYGTLLGINVSSALGNVTGGTWNNIADIPPKLLALGHKRLGTKQGIKILEKYGFTEQTLWLEPVGGVLENLSKIEKGLFKFMQIGEFYLRGSAVLSRIPESEFKSGQLSSRTRAIIRRQLGRTQGLFGTAQAPLLSQTTLIRPVFMFKHWMINEIELLLNFGKEFKTRFSRNRGWRAKTLGNEGLRRLTKYFLIGILFYLFGPEFLKKEIRQKLSIPAALISSFINWTETVPLYGDFYTAIKLFERIAYGEFREAREDFRMWIMKKPILNKHKIFFDGFIKGSIDSPTGELQMNITKAEAFKRWMVGNWTERGRKELELNEKLSKLLPNSNYTKWSQHFGARKVKTNYQKIKEDIMSKIEKRGYWNPEESTLSLDTEILRMFAEYNGRALDKLDEFFIEVEKLTNQKVEEKEKNSLMGRVTVQEEDIARWFQSQYEKETIPRILRRIK